MKLASHTTQSQAGRSVRGVSSAGAGLFEHGHARVLPQLPGELVGADIDREDVRRALARAGRR